MSRAMVVVGGIAGHASAIALGSAGNDVVMRLLPLGRRRADPAALRTDPVRGVLVSSTA